MRGRRGKDRLLALVARTGRSLRLRNYRLYASGHVVSVVGTWMQRVAQDWLVLELTGSAIAVGVATALQFLPLLVLGPWGGVVVDRFDRRRTIIGTQVASALVAVGLAVPVLLERATPGLVYALAFVLGCITLVDVPARHAFVLELVGPDHVINAQALNSTINNVGRMVGPAVAGLVIAVAGTGPAFALNAVSFLAVVGALMRMDVAQLRRGARAVRWRGSLKEGLAEVVRRPHLRACLLLVLVVALFGQNFRVVLPVFADETLGGGAGTYGWLMSALGVGAVIGGVVSAGREVPRARAALASAGAFAAANLLVAAAPGIAAAAALLAGLGASNVLFNTVSRAVLQTGVPSHLQGRVMALYSQVFLGTTPIGAPLVGWLAEATSPRVAFVLAGTTAGLATLALLRPLRNGY